MEDLIIHSYVLAGIFFVVALVYSSVGLGGGSSYTALMAIFGVSHVLIPTISLTLNVLVTTVGSFNYIRKRHARLDLMLPFFVTSIPMSYFGGTLRLPREAFYWLLLISLIFVALRIYLWDRTSLRLTLNRSARIAISLVAGAVLGLVAGIVGIGGGIYLVPLIIVLGLGTQKEAAACGSVFIFLNSASGLAARLMHHPVELKSILPLVAAVLIGGASGSHLGSSRLTPRTMEKILGSVILVAIFFLIRKLLA